MLLTRRAILFGAAAASSALAQKPAGDAYPDAAPFVTTPLEVAEAMLRLGGVKPGDVVYDLGSGDGRIVLMAARDFGAKAVGIEIDPDLVRESRERAGRAGLSDKVRIVEEDLFRSNLSEASVVTMYLLPKTLDKLKPKLQAELKPGTRIVSFAFSMSDWPPAKTQEVSSRRLYLWVIPSGTSK